jgi:curved DNA-binding protein CbpA
MLIKEARLDPAAIKRAMQVQTQSRMVELFGLSQGEWKSAPGKDARIFQIGVPIDPWPMLLRGLVQASDRELKTVSDHTLGKAVMLARGARLEGYALDEAAKKVLKYLEKPRKPDQLERAVGNRKLVRAILRLLEMEDALALEALAKAIPIPKATTLKSAVPGAVAPLSFDNTPSNPGIEEEAVEVEVEKRVAPERKVSARELPPIANELRAFREASKKKNHFELFGLPQNAQIDAVLLRKNYTVLAKKYHPDAFANDVPEEIRTLAREASAHLNAAYETLSDQAKRAEYLFLLADDRIKGDSRKAELIRDAETKSKMGMVMMKKKDFQKAREFFKYAAESDPSTGSYRASLAWAMFADPDFDKQQGLAKAHALVMEALNAKTIDAQTHYIAGQIMKARGEVTEAEHHFRAAVKMDKKHQDAQRELRLIEMRAEKAKQRGDSKSKGGALSKLFKRD